MVNRISNFYADDSLPRAGLVNVTATTACSWTKFSELRNVNCIRTLLAPSEENSKERFSKKCKLIGLHRFEKKGFTQKSRQQTSNKNFVCMQINELHCEIHGSLNSL